MNLKDFIDTQFWIKQTSKLVSVGSVSYNGKHRTLFFLSRLPKKFIFKLHISERQQIKRIIML